MYVRIPADSAGCLFFFAATADSTFRTDFLAGGNRRLVYGRQLDAWRAEFRERNDFRCVIANGGTAQAAHPPAAACGGCESGWSAGSGNLLVDGGTLNVTDDLHLNEGVAGPRLDDRAGRQHGHRVGHGRGVLAAPSVLRF